MGLRTLPEEETAIAVTDEVRDVMLFTVPVLRSAEVEAFVEPDILMKSDGYEGRFAKAYTHDEIPWIDLRHEVRDLMMLAVPDIALFQDDLSFEDVEIPADGMEACWAVANDVPAGLVEELVGSTVAELIAAIIKESRAAAHSVPKVPITLFSSEAMQTLCAPAVAGMLPMPGPVTVIGAAAVENAPAVEKLFDDPIFGVGVIEDIPEAIKEVVQIPVVDAPANYFEDAAEALVTEMSVAIPVIDVLADHFASEQVNAPIVEEVLENIPVEDVGFDIPYDIIVAGIVGKLVRSMLWRVPEVECAEPKPITIIIEDSPVEEVHIPTEIVAEAVNDTFGAPMAEEITVTSPESVPMATIVTEEPAAIGPQVRFSFGPQEVRGSGWRVCFSF